MFDKGDKVRVVANVLDEEDLTFIGYEGVVISKEIPSWLTPYDTMIRVTKSTNDKYCLGEELYFLSEELELVEDHVCMCKSYSVKCGNWEDTHMGIYKSQLEVTIEGYAIESFEINYCPMCGGKLKEE